jgi:UDP-N-acetylmuramate dehydrogenase
MVVDVPHISANGMTLAVHTTLRLGGPAGLLVVAADADEIVQGVRDATAGGGPALLLGGGSNVVVADEGFPGTVILIRSAGVRVVAGDAESVTVRVEAGESWDEVVATAVASGWSGLECLSGIPGAAGATPIQNVGAYGQEVAETITAVRVLDRHADQVRTMAPAECGFGYRTSVFRGSPRWVVLAVEFRLRRSAYSAPVRYAELAHALGLAPGGRAPLAVVREAVLGLRAGKGMVLDPADPDTYSAGSFFTNPVLDPAAHQDLVARAGDLGPVPSWPAQDRVKVSAAWLIERAGFGKGYPGRGVAVSSKHTLALTNRGTGTTAALLDLAREIRAGVADRFGVALHPEPVLVGCDL